MKPRSNIERAIVQLSSELSPLSEEQRLEALTIAGEIIATKEEGWCTACGYVWKDTEVWKKCNSRKECRCPHCGRKLQVCFAPRKTKQEDRYYYMRMVVIGGFNVQRTFFVRKVSTRGQSFYGIEFKEDAPKAFVEEVFQVWTDGQGNSRVVARNVHMNAYYCDIWNYCSDMTLHCWHDRYYVGGYLGKGARIIPEARKRGLTKLDDKRCLFRQLESALTDPISEILLKRGYRNLFLDRLRSGSKLRNVPWEAVNVATRHGYKFTDIDTWCDYIHDLQQLGLDIHSPHYVCPEDLGRIHLQMQARRARKTTRKEDIAKAEKENPKYLETFSKFFGMTFTSGDLTIRPFKSVREVLDEGNHLGHCVFRNEYYKNNNNLLLTARVDGKRAETVEVSLANFTILQSRGYGNQPTAFHHRIESLVNRNMDKIRRIATG